MIIQPLLFPSGICHVEGMFFSRHGSTLKLDTYFNSFSIGKWMEYAPIPDLSLHVHSKHNIDFKVFCGDEPIAFDASAEQDLYTVSIKELPKKGILSVSMDFSFDITDTPISNLITSGGYATSMPPRNDPSIDMGICTFHREPQLMANLRRIYDNILSNPDSVLYGKLKVHVADNGCSLPDSIFGCDDIIVYPNPNLGGAGGFTRTMVEAVYRSESPATHMLLTDDDILLDTRILERTYLLLGYISPEHSDAYIGGAMFDIDNMNLQVENGAAMSGFNNTACHEGLDATDTKSLSENEDNSRAEYLGWWYCCMPVHRIRENGLPLPVFLHYDDVEYGLRNRITPILINGICVWHPTMTSKSTCSVEYYDIRNRLITYGMLRDKRCSLMCTVINYSILTVGELLRYRYNVAEARMKGYEDFHKGPKAFMETDPIKNNSEVMALNYKYVSPKEAGISDELLKNIKLVPQDSGKIARYIRTLFCHILPPLKKWQVYRYDYLGVPYTAKKVYAYNPLTDSGYIVERNYGRLFKGLGKYFATVLSLMKNYKKDLELWHSEYRHITSEKFWEDYLKR